MTARGGIARKRSGDLADIDIAQQSIEHEASRRDERKTDREAEGVPARCPANDPRDR